MGELFAANIGFTVLTPQLLRLLQVRNESKRNPIYGSRFYSAYEKYYKNNRNTKQNILLQVDKESKRNPIYGSRFYSASEKNYKNNRNNKYKTQS